MKLLLPLEIVARLVKALEQAERKEIGGILMGEHFGPEIFRVREVTIQRKGGTFAAFVRVVAEILGPLRAFFDATKHDYKGFNYLGEWHSHHSIALKPSDRDHQTMNEMIMDSDLGANFVVLLLVKLDHSSQLESCVTVYQPNRHSFIGQVVHEESASRDRDKSEGAEGPAN